jgi:hypothetical protein
MTTTDFAITAIDPATADGLRRRGGPVTVVDEHPGYPCRQCLTDAEVGEELILVSHDPFEHDSPYRCASPIYLHRASCTPYQPGPELPSQLTRRELAVRAFDGHAMMIDAAIIDGTELDKTARHLLGDPDTDHLLVYNAVRGCWAARIDRTG